MNLKNSWETNGQMILSKWEGTFLFNFDQSNPDFSICVFLNYGPVWKDFFISFNMQELLRVAANPASDSPSWSCYERHLGQTHIFASKLSNTPKAIKVVCHRDEKKKIPLRKQHFLSILNTLPIWRTYSCLWSQHSTTYQHTTELHT